MKKDEKYKALFPLIESLVDEEPNIIARMANIASLLHHEFGFLWTGFYQVRGIGSGSNFIDDIDEESELVLAPFQGTLACTRINYGKGVCGTAWAQNKTIIVPDVEKFPGHIACSSQSKSEIVVPIRKGKKVAAVLDIDSKELNTFDEVDAKWLEKIAHLIYGLRKEIWFAAGCFWGTQKFFDSIKGVEFTEVGFANGDVENPTYKQVYTDTTGHAECVHIKYDPSIVSLRVLVRVFFLIINPMSLNKQGEDEGTRYRTGVYFKNDSDYNILKNEFTLKQNELGQEIAVELLPLKCFYTAEEYHQKYLEKNPDGYCHLNPEVFKIAKKYKDNEHPQSQN